MMYNKLVEECFFHPRHVGLIELNSPFVAHTSNVHNAHSVRIDLYMQSDKQGIIIKVLYKTNGNPYCIAALEYISRLLLDKSLNSSHIIDHKTLAEHLDIPSYQYPVVLLVTETYKELLKKMISQYERL